MNQRRLLIVVVLAALFGAALPYGIFILSGFAKTGGYWGVYEIPAIHGSVQECHWRGRFSESTTMRWTEKAPTTEEWARVKTGLDGLLPDDASRMQTEPMGHVMILQCGWPFRAAHMCLAFNPSIRKSPATSTVWIKDSTVWDWAPAGALLGYVPLGVRWTGAIGNACVSAMFFGALYCGLASWRARHRIKRGKCWKCGYLSHGAAVCPECGAETL